MSNTSRLLIGAFACLALAGCMASTRPQGGYSAVQQDSGISGDSGGGQRALGNIPNNRPQP